MPFYQSKHKGNPRHLGRGSEVYPVSRRQYGLTTFTLWLLASSFWFFNSANAANVNITGLTAITNKEALDILKPRLVFIEARKASPARASDAAFLLTQLLKRQGLPAAKVAWKTPNEDTISLIVEEGPIRVIGNISLYNVDNQKLHDEILDYYLEPPLDTPLFSDAALPYLAESVVTAEKDATQFLNAKGYWSAKITSENIPNPVDLSLVRHYGKSSHHGRVPSPKNRPLQW